MKGLLLINVGTPEAPDTEEVRTYLREFLGDPHILDMNRVGRWALLELVILPTRPAESAAAYRKVWTPEGSPLLVHSNALAVKVQALLGEDWRVEVGMRYGQPSLASALDRFAAAGIDRIVLLPMYPQYSSAAWASSVERVAELVEHRPVVPATAVVPPFWDTPGYLDSFAEVARETLAGFAADHVLFSYHGLPERQVSATDATGAHCLKSESCCDRIVTANRACYRAQCFATTREIVARVGLDAARTSTSFQSRLGRIPWIRPYTDQVLVELAHAGVRRLAVLSPAFVADCLETLEEIAMRGKETFVEAGGHDLVLVPSLNSRDSWAKAVVQLVRDNVAW